MKLHIQLQTMIKNDLTVEDYKMKMKIFDDHLTAIGEVATDCDLILFVIMD